MINIYESEENKRTSPHANIYTITQIITKGTSTENNKYSWYTIENKLLCYPKYYLDIINGINYSWIECERIRLARTKVPCMSWTVELNFSLVYPCYRKSLNISSYGICHIITIYLDVVIFWKYHNIKKIFLVNDIAKTSQISRIYIVAMAFIISGIDPTIIRVWLNQD